MKFDLNRFGGERWDPNHIPNARYHTESNWLSLIGGLQ